MVCYSRILPNFFRGFGNVNFPNFPKPSKKLRTFRSSEIRKYSFRLGNRPESSAKSSECRDLNLCTKGLQINIEHWDYITLKKINIDIDIYQIQSQYIENYSMFSMSQWFSIFSIFLYLWSKRKVKFSF
jgi:hypothetical protein